MSDRHDEPIAIVGIGCRLPGGISGAGQLWEFLCERGDAICPVPQDRWDSAALFAADPAAAGRTYAREAGFLERIDEFDPEFFGISPREAAGLPSRSVRRCTRPPAAKPSGRWYATSASPMSSTRVT